MLDRSVMSRCLKLSADYIGGISFSTVVCETCPAEPNTFFVFGIYLGVFRDGTLLAMLKTIYMPDSSSLKPGSGATEGVLD